MTFPLCYHQAGTGDHTFLGVNFLMRPLTKFNTKKQNAQASARETAWGRVHPGSPSLSANALRAPSPSSPRIHVRIHAAVPRRSAQVPKSRLSVPRWPAAPSPQRRERGSRHREGVGSTGNACLGAGTARLPPPPGSAAF